MIKRLSASILVLIMLVISSCQQLENEEAVDKTDDLSQYEPAVINVNDIIFIPPDLRAEQLGADWQKNKTLTRYIDPETLNVKVDMSEDRRVNLSYDKEFALKVMTQNPKGYGSISIPSQWVKEGQKISFKALSGSQSTFVKWVGDIKDGVQISGNQITVLMNKPRFIAAVFASNENELKIDSDFGKPQGAGIYKRGRKAKWSVTSPFRISDSERAVAPVSSGSLELTDDKTIKIDWQKEYLINVVAGDMGSVKSSGPWIPEGEPVVISALPVDRTIAFSHWEGVDEEKAKINPLTMTVNKAYNLRAVFARKQFLLKVITKHGEVKGAGLQANGADAAWSVTSPVATDRDDVRLAAVTPSGTVKMDGDKEVKVEWVKEFLVTVHLNRDGTEAPGGEHWVKEGEMLNLDKLTGSFDPELDKFYSWSGHLPKDKREDYPLTLKVTEPMVLTANLMPIKTTLTFSNDVDNKDDIFEYTHTKTAKHKVPNLLHVNDSVRMVLNKPPLKNQVDELEVQESDKAVVRATSNIQVIDYQGWKDCVRIRTDLAQLIISPAAGRVVYYGSPDGKTNLLWLNDDYKGSTTTQAQAKQNWADKGGSRVWIAPFEARVPLLKRQFPPAYEIDGAPYRNVIISGDKVIIQNFASAEYGCAIERAFELKGNKLTVETSLVQSNGTKHDYLLGPAMMTQFVRPDKITFGKSKQLTDHTNGYVVLKGTGPEVKVNVSDQNKFTLEVPAENDSEWKIGSQTEFTQLEFKRYAVNIYSIHGSSAAFSQKNCNVTIYAPETPADFIEIGNFGELYGLGKKHVSLLVWKLERR